MQATVQVAELLLQRGFEISYETIRIWKFRFAPPVSTNLRTRRRGQRGRSWYLDETYVKVSGRWPYLYRAIDRDGNLLDSMLSQNGISTQHGVSFEDFYRCRITDRFA